MRALWLLLPLTVACNNDDKVEVADDSGGPSHDDSGDPNTDDSADDSSGGDDSEPPPCESNVLQATPEDGAVEVEITTDPTFILDYPDPTAVISTDIPGVQWISDDALTVVWVPDPDMDWETSYSVTLTTCSSTTTTTFTTATAPEPANDLVDRSWMIDLNEATLTEPAGVGAFLDGSLMSVFLGVSGVDVGTVDLRMALDDGGGNQDTCIASIEWTGIGYDADRTFAGHMDSADLPLLGDEPLTIYDVDITGQWSADGSELVDGTIDGLLDVRDFEDAVGMSGDDICAFGAFLGFTCEACPSGEEYCVGALIEDMHGEEAGIALIEVAANDCPDCETGEPVCE